MPWPHTFGAQSGNVPASDIDDNFNAAAFASDVTSLQVTVAALPSTDIPLIPVASGAAGSSSTLSKSDHQHPPQAATVNAQSGTSYTLVATDNGKVIEFTNAAAITVTIPAAFAAGSSCLLVQTGAGQVTIVAGGGMTLRQASGFTKTRTQWSVISSYIRANATDVVLSGDMA